MRALSLFSGIGGIDLACEWAGIETVAFCEREPFPQKVLRKHWPDVPIYDDVCTLTKERLEADGIRSIELIHGGYPCQPFSTAGNRKGAEDDRHLWPEYFRLVQEIRPRWVVGENVAGHVSLGLDIVLADLESEGYTARAFIIPACGVNAPHRRDRVFVVAHTNSNGDDSEKRSGIDRNWEEEVQKRFESFLGLGNEGANVPYTYEQHDDYSRYGTGKIFGERSAQTIIPRGEEDVADTSGERCGEAREYQSERSKKRTAGCGEIVSNSPSPGLSIGGRSERTEGIEKTGARMESESERRGKDVSYTNSSGLKEQYTSSITNRTRFNTWGTSSGWDHWSVEPDVGRVANGIPQRVDRLKSLGNAVVPQQIYPIFAAIMQIEATDSR